MKINLKELSIYRVASSAPKLKVANPFYNANEIIKLIQLAESNYASILLTPELSLSSYSCGDLFLNSDFINTNYKALDLIIEATNIHKVNTIVGLPVIQHGKLFNAAAFISKGKILGIVPKTYLCNTSEYYEERWFSSENDRLYDSIVINSNNIPFGADLLFQDGHNTDFIIGIEICEDLWSVVPPSLFQASAGATLLCNLSASNEYLGKTEFRRKIVEMQSAKCLSGYLYASSGPNESTTDTIFSGHLIYSEYGNILADKKSFSFENELLVADIDLEKLSNERIKNNSFGASRADKKFRIIEFENYQHKVDKLLNLYSAHPFIPESKIDKDNICFEISTIQSNALIKRLKHIGIESVVIGISGGSDSTLALLSTVKAFDIAGFDRKNIHAVTIPGLATGTRTKKNADMLINKLGVNYISIDIKEIMKIHFNNIGHEIENFNVVFENAQARERTQILMDLANKFNGIVVGTGDLSELALGWCTYNADQMSMYGINAGVPKTLVKLVIQWYSENEFSELSNTLNDILETPITPELIPSSNENEFNQDSEKILGPYEIHDFFLYYFIRRSYSLKKIFLLARIAYNEKYSQKEILKWLNVFVNRFFNNQFKRSAMPDGIKIGSVSLSPRADWRMPSDADKFIYLDELRNIEKIINKED